MTVKRLGTIFIEIGWDGNLLCDDDWKLAIWFKLPGQMIRLKCHSEHFGFRSQFDHFFRIVNLAIVSAFTIWHSIMFEYWDQFAMETPKLEVSLFPALFPSMKKALLCALSIYQIWLCVLHTPIIDLKYNIPPSWNVLFPTMHVRLRGHLVELCWSQPTAFALSDPLSGRILCVIHTYNWTWIEMSSFQQLQCM